MGRVAKVADNRYFLPESLERLAKIACDLAAPSPDGSFTAAVFKDRSGVGRNLTIAILEYLDKMGATRRVRNARFVLAYYSVENWPSGEIDIKRLQWIWNRIGRTPMRIPCFRSVHIGHNAGRAEPYDLPVPSVISWAR